MRLITILALFAFAPTGFGQNWEIGGAGGGAFATTLPASNSAGQGNAGFTNTFALGAMLGQDLHRRLSGEIRYTFRPGDLKLTSGASSATFQALSHAIHYDLVIHSSPAGAKLRPFFAAGGGVKIFRGTGREAAYQPLQEIALLTKTQEWKPLISFGGGLKYALSPRVLLRVEFRDYLTPFPKKVITPAAGTKLNGWLHDITPLVGLSILF